MFEIDDFSVIKKEDEEVYNAILSEVNRLNNNIELIASENCISPSVMAAVSSVMTNKYAEGYPGKRYYGGCVNMDTVETLAKQRLSKLFECEKYDYTCNVQPHSGAQANMAVYMAMLNPRDKILGMSMQSGGHLTHGSSVNFSGKLYNVHSYNVNAQGYIDYDALEKLAEEIQPKLIIAGASAYPRTIDFKRFYEIAKKVNAYLMADIAHIAGLIVAKQHPSPLPYADFITSTTHKTLRGTRGGIIMCKAEFEKKINSSVFPGTQGGPLMHIIAGKAVAFQEALKPDFIEYQKQIIKNAKVLSEELMKQGIKLVSSGTDNHLMLIDLRNLNITGKDAEILLDSVNITVNRNGVPNDPEPPTISSGIRIGTPAITTRGFKEEECKEIAKIMAEVLKNPKDQQELTKARIRVDNLCKKFPVYRIKSR